MSKIQKSERFSVCYFDETFSNFKEKGKFIDQVEILLKDIDDSFTEFLVKNTVKKLVVRHKNYMPQYSKVLEATQRAKIEDLTIVLQTPFEKTEEWTQALKKNTNTTKITIYHLFHQSSIESDRIGRTITIHSCDQFSKMLRGNRYIH